jgi:16S rRNA C967 or C1407 C5-methylase (RsmB/RsmF family)
LPPYKLFLSLNLGNNFDAQSKKKIKFDIIDACSAPGNKTIQLAEYLGTRGRVWAFERD